MAFRVHKHFGCCSFAPEKRVEYVQKGKKYVKIQDMKRLKLPPIDDYSLDKIIASGLPLEKVNTVMLAHSFSADNIQYESKKDDKSFDSNTNTNKE